MYRQGDILTHNGKEYLVIEKLYSNAHTYDGIGIDCGIDYSNIYILKDINGNIIEIEESEI